MTEVTIRLVSSAHAVTAAFELEGLAYIFSSASVHEVLWMAADTLRRLEAPTVLSFRPKEASTNGNTDP